MGIRISRLNRRKASPKSSTRSNNAHNRLCALYTHMNLKTSFFVLFFFRLLLSIVNVKELLCFLRLIYWFPFECFAYNKICSVREQTNEEKKKNLFSMTSSNWCSFWLFKSLKSLTSILEARLLQLRHRQHSQPSKQHRANEKSSERSTLKSKTVTNIGCKNNNMIWLFVRQKWDGEGKCKERANWLFWWKSNIKTFFVEAWIINIAKRHKQVICVRIHTHRNRGVSRASFLFVIYQCMQYRSCPFVLCTEFVLL